jgi:hypothetical protein
MQMNIRKGLLRLWIVGSILFVICVFAVSYSSLREHFRIANTDYDAIAKDLGGYSVLPTDCSGARGVSGSDYSQSQDLCWYRTEDFRRLYPEYEDVGDDLFTDFDNGRIERFHRSLKEEEVWLHEYQSFAEARDSIARWIHQYNHQRPHQALNYRTPVAARQAFHQPQPLTKTEALCV